MVTSGLLKYYLHFVLSRWQLPLRAAFLPALLDVRDFCRVAEDALVGQARLVHHGLVLRVRLVRGLPRLGGVRVTVREGCVKNISALYGVIVSLTLVFT